MSRATLFLLLLGICSFGHAQHDLSAENSINETSLKSNETFSNDPYRIFRFPYIFPEFLDPANDKSIDRNDKIEDPGIYYSPFFQHFFPDLFRKGNITERTGIIFRNGKPCSTRIIIRTITQNIQEKPKRYKKMDNLAIIFPHLKWIMLLLFIWIVFALIGIGTLRRVNARIIEAKSQNDPTQRC